jgi:Ca-activated chloride channel family protein
MSLLRNIEFANPWFLLLLLLIPIFAFWNYKSKQRRHVDIPLPSLKGIANIRSNRSILLKYLPILRALAFSLFVIALARPQTSLKEEDIKAEGIDIFLAIDLSSSMLARDFKPDRLEVSKAVAIDFVGKREFDRIGLAVFAGESFTQCPLTTDHKVVNDFLGSLNCGFLEDGTAIGMGLASAVNRLKDSKAKSKVVILLTDGVNNSGYVRPITAAEIAKEFDIKVYTIGVGSSGNALTPVSRRSNGEYVFGMARVQIDEALLEEIANMTGGKYYRATSEQALQNIYDEINTLEKTEMQVTTVKRYSDEFRIFLLAGLIFFLLELLLKYVFLRSIP